MTNIHGRFTEYDPLQLYFGDDYKLNKYITIHQPSIKEIVDYGEKEYYSMIYTLCAIPSDMKSFITDELKKDYETMSDFELFIVFSRLFTQKQTEILFGKLDLTKMVPFIRPIDQEPVLIDLDTGFEMDKVIYQQMIDYVRAMHHITPKVEKAKDAQTKKFLIELDRIDHQTNKNKKWSSMLLPLISSMLCHPGFKYNKETLKDIGIVEFMDAVQRIQIIMSVDALMKGMYSGMIDTKQIKQKDLNWLRAIEETKPKGLGIKLS